MLFTDSFFIFNGAKTNEFDILVEKPPSIISPPKRIETFTVPGRSGTLYSEDNAYDNYTKTVECALMSTKYLDYILKWLKGYGEAVFSNEPDKKYRAMIANQIPFEKVLFHYKRFIVIFDCHPYKFSVNPENDYLESKIPFHFLGKGSDFSEPIMTVYGTGDIQLIVNDEKIGIKGVQSYITLNSEIQDCHKDGENQNSKMTGNFPCLSTGENDIRWTGNVTKIEIIPQWRWL